jgi:hypothetical protein
MSAEITVTDKELVLPKGLRLALIDEKGTIIEEGDSLKKAVFDNTLTAAIQTMKTGIRITRHSKPV